MDFEEGKLEVKIQEPKSERERDANVSNLFSSLILPSFSSLRVYLLPVLIPSPREEESVSWGDYIKLAYLLISSALQVVLPSPSLLIPPSSDSS